MISRRSLLAAGASGLVTGPFVHARRAIAQAGKRGGTLVDKNYGPNLGYDYGGRLRSAWLDR